LAAIHHFGPFELRPQTRLLLKDGSPVELGARAFDLLQALIERRDRLVTKTELLDLVWPGVIVEENNLQVQVSTLRKILGQEAIKTVPGRGYRFALELDEAAPDVAAGAGGPPISALPRLLTSFVGRESELDEYGRLLDGERLVTLTAVGGSGKTRLAIELARSKLASFPDGIWFVDLAPVAAPERVTLTVAATLGVREEPDRPILDTLCARLERKHALLVLDNCEHVVAACAAFVEALLAHTANVMVLATSRERLGIAGEHAVVVRPLEASESVRLFVDRARLVASDFVPASDTQLAVEGICRRLEGLPLAIELAAARVKVLSVDEINARLEDRFRLLTSSGRAQPRHQTLRGVIDWSYEQLEPREQQAFRRLSVFAGGWTLAAATAVTGSSDEFETIETLTRLVDKSLVLVERAASGQPRYRMLETVRAYAEEQLELAGETREVRARHLAHFVSLAETLPKWSTLEEIPAFERLDAELDNMLAALHWCAHSASGAEVGLRLVLALRRYLTDRGHLRLGRSLVEHWLAHPDLRSSGPLRAQALLAAGSFAEDAGDESAASAYLTSALAIARDAGDRDVEIHSLRCLGSTERTRGNLGQARSFLEQSLALARACGSPYDVAAALVDSGEVCRMEEDLDGAAARYEEGVAILRRHGLEITTSVLNLVTIADERRDYATAGRYLREAVVESRARSSRYLDWCVLQHAAALAAAVGDAPFAARAWGALESVAAATGLVLQRADVDYLIERIGRARRALGEQAFEEACAAGRVLSPEDGVAEVGVWLERYLASANAASAGTANVKP
jgi:predicted ATPase/DNA-binding winged helix-turn-helix (wHTH) protein